MPCTYSLCWFPVLIPCTDSLHWFRDSLNPWFLYSLYWFLALMPCIYWTAFAIAWPLVPLPGHGLDCLCHRRAAGPIARSRFVCVCVCFCVPWSLMHNENPISLKTLFGNYPPSFAHPAFVHWHAHTRTHTHTHTHTHNFIVSALNWFRMSHISKKIMSGESNAHFLQSSLRLRFVYKFFRTFFHQSARTLSGEYSVHS